jgi:hypothetical protein
MFSASPPEADVPITYDASAATGTDLTGARFGTGRRRSISLRIAASSSSALVRLPARANDMPLRTLCPRFLAGKPEP